MLLADWKIDNNWKQVVQDKLSGKKTLNCLPRIPNMILSGNEEDWKLEFEPTTLDWSWEKALFQIDKDTYGIAYSDNSSDGQIKSLNIITEDNTKPKFEYIKLSEDNTHMIVQMNEQTFKASTGIGEVEKTDFVLSITGGTATLASKNPVSLTKENDRYLLTIGYNGLKDGTETLKIEPASNSIFDGKGNVADVTQSNNTFKLTENTPPKFIASKISDDNAKIEITFDEPVFKQKGGSGNLEKEDFFYIGKMQSYNNDFTLYFKTRSKAVLARGEEFNYITDYPQDLYIYNNHTKSDESLISYDWFPSKAKQIIENYDFPVFPEDFAYYLLNDNNTLIMVSAIKNINANLVFDISKRNLKRYDKKNRLEFIISSVAKKCGYLSLEEKYNCNYYKPLISNNLIN